MSNAPFDPSSVSKVFMPTDPELTERLYRMVDGRWIIADITREPTLYTEVRTEIADGWRKHNCY